MSEYDARLVDRVRTRGVLGPDDAAHLLLPVADALAVLHARGMAHGALSPAAVRIDREGRAAVVDPAELAPDPSYAAPDPSAGFRPHPAAADLWAFAALLLFVTTGVGPRDAAGAAVPRTTGWLGPLIELALRPDPRERPTMAEAADYLRARAAGTPTRTRRPSATVLGIVGAAVVTGMVLLGAVLLLGDRDGRETTPVAPRVGAPEQTDEQSGRPEDPTVPAAEPVSAAELVRFARDYVRIASTDPDRGFALLTRSYQRASPRYHAVWTAIQEPEILAINADPTAMAVSYTYRYTLAGAPPRTEDVTLHVVRHRGRLLIADASARRP